MMNTVVEGSPSLKSVADAVDALISRKMKPDESKMLSYLMDRYNVNYSNAEHLIEMALSDGIVVKVNYADSISFRTPEKFRQMMRNHQNRIIPYKGSLMLNRTIIRVCRAVNQICQFSSSYNPSLGVCVSDIIKQLHSSLQLLNYNEFTLTNVLREAKESGFINSLSNDNYILTSEQKKSLDEMSLQSDNSCEEMIIKTESKSGEESSSKDIIRKRKHPVERVRPVSQRKRIKKSLGPDFVESSELGHQYHRNSFDHDPPQCDVCLTSSSDDIDNLLICKNCDIKAHPNCLEYSTEYALNSKARKSQWRCAKCKKCNICKTSGDSRDEWLLICNNCGKGYHTNCHNPRISTEPKDKWNCYLCSNTKSHVQSKFGSINVNIKQNGVNVKIGRISQNTVESSFSSSEENQTLKTEPEYDQMSVNTIDASPETEKSIVEDQTNAKDDTSADVSNSNSSKSENYTDIEPKVESFATENALQQLSLSINNPLPQNPQEWTVEEVVSFIRNSGFPDYANVFRDQEIDGSSLMLLRRMDVLTGLSMKLGPALKIYSHIARLQGRDQYNYNY